MKTPMKVLAAGEVAKALRDALGPIRSWDDALADMRAGKTAVCGHQLLPVCRVKHARQWRPAYLGKDVAEFIHAVRNAMPSATSGMRLEWKTVEIDLDDGLYWQMRELMPVAVASVAH